LHTCHSHDEESMNCFDKALKIDQNDVEAWSDRGIVLVKLDKHQEALQSFNKSLELDPTFEPALNGKNEILEAKK